MQYTGRPNNPTRVMRYCSYVDVDTVHNILSWATQGQAVTAYMTGPMAHQIREHSKELGMTPEMFVWHAVKVFIETGTSP